MTTNEHKSGDRDRLGTNRSASRRWLRRLAIVLAVLSVVAGTGLWIVTRSWFIIARVQPELERRLGGTVTIGHASYLGSGQFLFSDVLLRAPNLTGPASELMRIQRVELETATSSWRTGTPEITAVRIEGVQVRLSEDAAMPGRFNFMTLRPTWPESDLDDEPTVPPEVLVSGAVIQMGEHDTSTNDGYRLVGERRFAGQLVPGDGALFHFVLGETDALGNLLGDAGMIIRGNWNVRSNAYDCRLDGLHLNESTLSVCPSHVREWWERMDLQGAVSSATIAWAPDTVAEMRLNVERVTLTLPIEHDGFWARYRDGQIEDLPSRPRLNVNSGSIVLRPDAAELQNLRGALVSGDQMNADENVDVPYVVNMAVRLPDVPDGQAGTWFDQMLTHAAFDMDFRLERFAVTAGANRAVIPAVDLPEVVADALRRFEMRQWTLETQVSVSRGQPVVAADGSYRAQPIMTEGRAFIDHADCAYDKFPYPMQGVSATIHFDNDALDIISLTGRSSNGRAIRLTGRITPLDITAGAELRLTGSGIALDDVLRDAMPAQSRQAFDAMFDREAYARLVDAGAIVDADDIERFRVQRRTTMNALRELENRTSLSTDELRSAERLQAEADRLARLIAIGPFEMGGTVDLDLRIQREVGRGQPTVIKGDMAIQRADLVYERFPYPLAIRSGTLVWKPDAIQIGSGANQPIEFVTPGGGAGSVWGTINLSYGPSRVEPDLHFRVTDDLLNDAIYKAIPISDDREVQIADILESLRLDAWTTYSGSVTTDAAGKADYDFTANLSRGVARPDSNVTEMIGMSGLHWPESLILNEVEASLRVSRDGVTVDEVHARHGQGIISGHGAIRGGDAGTSINIDFTDMPVDAYLVDLAPTEGVDRVREIWKRYQPTGTFDAHISYDDQNESGHPMLRFEPNAIVVQIDNAPFAIERAAGSIDIAGGAVQFDDLDLRLMSGERADGQIILAGSYGASAGESDLRVAGTWVSGRFESPAVPEVMHLVAAEDLASRYRHHELRGDFDATFSYQSPGAGHDREFRIDLYPQTVSMLFDGVRVDAQLDEGAMVSVTPGETAIAPSAGMINESRFDVSGVLTYDSTWRDARFDIGFDGQLSDPEVQALLPTAVQDAMLAIEMREASPSYTAGCELRLWNRQHTSDADAGIDAQFTGVIHARDVSFIAGGEFEHVMGAVDINYSRFADEDDLTINANVDEMLVLGQRVTNGTAVIELAGLTDPHLVIEARGDCYGGAVSADATVGVGEHRDYAVGVNVAGVGLAEMYDAALVEAAGGEPPPSPNVGQVFGNLTMSGRRGDEPSSAVGRGSVRVINAAMARMPITLRLIQLLEFMPPLSESFNYADAAFYVDGNRLIFENILLECPTLQLVGAGEMQMDTLEVDWILQTRGTLSVIRDLVGGFSNTLFGIHVTGPLKDPSAELVPIPAIVEPTGRMQETGRTGLADAISSAGTTVKE